MKSQSKFICKFEFMNGETKKLEVYERPIEFPDKAPKAFHAICQWGYEVFHQEKLTLLAHIELLEETNAELVAELSKLGCKK